VAERSTKIETETPKASYLTSDHLGSPRVVTNKQGEVVSRRDFMPFGEEIAAMADTHRTPGDKYGVGDGVRQKFTGYERDDETDLDFAEARYYNFNNDRFTTTDPLLSSGRVENPQTWNRYAYVLNDPLNYIDPTGLYECKGTKAQCDQFEQRLNEAKAYLKKIEDRYGKDSDQYRKVNDSLNAYGAKDEKNGVIIAFNNKEGNGERVNAEFEKGKLVSVTVTFDKTALDDNSSSGLVGHAGNHVDYFQTVGNNTNDKYKFEFKAHEVQSLLAEARNPDGNSFIRAKDGTKYDIWNSGWKEADRETERAKAINKWLAVPPPNGKYGLTPPPPPKPKPTSQRRRRG
jgi:RHS repeat-associated protein